MSGANADADAHSVLIAVFATDAGAHLACDGLRAAGIEATVIPSSAIGAIGGAQEAYARVFVAPGDVDHARTIIGAPPPATPAATLASPPREPPPRRLFTALLIGVLLAVTPVLALRVVAMGQTIEASTNSIYDPPYYDGNCEIYFWKGTDIRGTAYCDEDKTTGYEVTLSYDAKGRVSSKMTDPDMKGVPEEHTAFDTRGVPTLKTIDANQDGIAELTILYDRNGNESGQALDPDEDGRVDSWVEKKGDDTEAWIDSKGDGSADRMERKTSTGQIVETLTESPDGWVLKRPDPAGQ